MEKKNVVERAIINEGNINIGDNINIYYGYENSNDVVQISKTSYRELAAYPLFELPVHYIPRSFITLKSIKETKKYYFPNIEYRPLNSLLYENQKIVLLGDAGMGKSTELKWLYNELLKSEQNVFPVWISLNNYTFDDSLSNYIVSLDGIPYENILLIMDGFDEMISSDIPKLNRQIGNVLSKFKNIQILISSRKNTFDIDSQNSNSSLPDFEIYYLNELSLIEIENYFETYDTLATFDEFLQELERVKFAEIIKNPFYLNIVIEFYLLENKLPDSRSELMNKCINSMVLSDDKRNKKIIQIDVYDLKRVIEKVALSMEIFGRNTIVGDNLKMLLESNEYNILKYFGGFKKEVGKNDVFKFDHNNFQEYLAARAISQCCFEDILKCISFEPAYDMLNPFWLNTIGYLLEEIKDESTYQLLLSWLLIYNKHFLVGAEPKRIDNEIRLAVFKEIFNEYEKDDQFLYSNQFSDEKLAIFAGNHEEVFDFLIDKFQTSNSVKVKINALTVLSYLNYSANQSSFDALYEVCSQIIDNQEVRINSSILQATVSCLVQTVMLSEDQIAYVFNKISHETIIGVISETLNLVNQSKNIDKFVHYLTNTFTIIHEYYNDDFEITYKLKKSLERITTKYGIYQILKYLDKEKYTWEKEKSLDFLNNLFNNAIELYKTDKTIYDIILNTAESPELLSKAPYQASVLRFLNQTKTRDLAFWELWERKLKGNCNSFILSLIVTNETINNLVSEIKANIEYNGNNWLYGIKSSQNDQKESVFKAIYEGSKSVEDENSNFLLKLSNFTQYSFDLLFNSDSFKSEMINALKFFDKNVISKEDINFLIDKNYIGPERFIIPDSVISLLQGLLQDKKNINISQITDFIENNEKLQNYRFIKIRERIQGNSNLLLNIEQIQQLEFWVKETLGNFPFSKLNSRIKHCIADYTVRFNFNHPEEILIQFIPYENFLCYNTNFFNWLNTKLSPKVMVSNIIFILNSDDELPESVLLNFYKYLVDNGVKNISHLIIDSIRNNSFDQRYRIWFIDEYLKSNGSNIKHLIATYDGSEKDVKWHLIDKFIEHGEFNFALNILKSQISNENIDLQDRINAIERLVRLEDPTGFDLYLSELCDSNVSKMDHWKGIKNIKLIESIPFLVKLLEICLINQSKIDVFDRSTSDVIRSIENIALNSYDNFMRIQTEYKYLISVLPNDKAYLLVLSAGLKERFYRNLVERRTVVEVKTILKSLEK